MVYNGKSQTKVDDLGVPPWMNDSDPHFGVQKFLSAAPIQLPSTGRSGRYGGDLSDRVPARRWFDHQFPQFLKKNWKWKNKTWGIPILGRNLDSTPSNVSYCFIFFNQSPNFNFKHNLPSWIQASADSQRAAKLLLIEEPRKRLVKGIRKRALAEMAGVSSSLHSKNEMVDLWWI